MDTRRITLSLGAAAGGLLAVAFAQMAVASADESSTTDYFYLPDASSASFTGGTDLGDLFTSQTGTESWDSYNTSAPTTLVASDVVTGTETNTLSGIPNVLQFGTDDLTVTSDTVNDVNGLTAGSTVDYSYTDLLGQVYGLEVIDPDAGSIIGPGETDIFISPFGDFSF